MKRLLALLAFIVVVRSIGEIAATGYYGPMLYLDDGGRNVDASPEFYWELEVKRLATQFHPTEKRVAGKMKQSEADLDVWVVDGRPTTDADLKDFAAAIQERRIAPVDSVKASEQHEAARNLIDQADGATVDPMPEEFASEFADYHRGAFAYRRGKEHWEEARQAWEDLLKRPDQERHYRTVWATFMLGKLALKRGDSAAVTWFQKTREMAQAGFADSLGMAADSYGWEGRSEWKQQHPAKAARLFLTQLALGDESAIVSLKALVPDRIAVEGMLNYGPEPDEVGKWTDQEKKEAEQKAVSGLREAVKDPLLRRLETAQILATASEPNFYSDTSSNAPAVRCARWLAMIKQSDLGQLEDAEYLGWVAYNSGDYETASRWLDLSKSETAAAWWLRAKLQRRAGKLSDAVSSMAKAWQLIHEAIATERHDERGNVDRLPAFADGHWSFSESASGDLGGLRLARGDFVQAFDVLWKGGLWSDAAFVAERVLTANELKKYVDDQGDTSGKTEGRYNIEGLRYLLGRRLVREDRYAEAAHYLRSPYDQVLEKYTRALNSGADPKLSKTERARALFAAAWLARYDGMELMGTEVAPDGFVESGSFEVPDLAKQRRSGFYEQERFERGVEKKPLVLKASRQEVQRLTANKIDPDLRFHYRSIAAALAIRAAALLRDNSEELADVVNRAGLWVKDRDEKAGNRYFQILEQRSPETALGRAAIQRHWFVDQEGPWSKEAREEHEKLHKELKIEDVQP